MDKYGLNKINITKKKKHVKLKCNTIYELHLNLIYFAKIDVSKIIYKYEVLVFKVWLSFFLKMQAYPLFDQMCQIMNENRFFQFLIPPSMGLQMTY